MTANDATLLSAAIDEIYALRTISALVHRELSSHLPLKSLTVGDRRTLHEEIDRLKLAATGHAQRAISNLNADFLNANIYELGGSPRYRGLYFQDWAETVPDDLRLRRDSDVPDGAVQDAFAELRDLRRLASHERIFLLSLARINGLARRRVESLTGHAELLLLPAATGNAVAALNTGLNPTSVSKDALRAVGAESELTDHMWLTQRPGATAHN